MGNNKCEQSFMNKIKRFISYVNIFDIPQLIKEISCDVKDIKNKYDETITSIEQYKNELEKEKEIRAREKNLFISVLDHLDDMVWAKDMDGKYIVANKAFRYKFCYGMTWEELQGRTDQEIAKVFKHLVGEENHTFGEMCANSDVVIHESKVPRQFLEEGNINGKLMKLVVNKSPVYNFEGKMFATCGTGRDVTKWHNDIEKAIEETKSGCSCFQHGDEERILNELNKFKFEEGGHAK